MAACRHYQSLKGRRLSFEWALIDRVNDRPVDADLARFAGDHPTFRLTPVTP